MIYYVINYIIYIITGRNIVIDIEYAVIQMGTFMKFEHH